MPPSEPAAEAQPRLELIDDFCRFCSRTTARRHPAGVVKGSNWRCLEPDCMHWQQRDYTAESQADGA